jgi:hypothetical protein
MAGRSTRACLKSTGRLKAPLLADDRDALLRFPRVWDQLVRSLIDEDGALHKTMAQLVAVSLSPDTAGADAKHVFRIYVRCVFYERAVRSVVECLMAEFGIAKFEVRSVLYDELGIGDEDEQPTLKKGFRFPAALWTENIVDEKRQAVRLACCLPNLSDSP